MSGPNRLVVGISGASGVIYGIHLLQALKDLPVEAHLVMTHTAEITLAHETTLKVADVHGLADKATGSTIWQLRFRAAPFARST